MGGHLLQGFEVSRAEYFWVDPNDLSIAGIDKGDESHRHYDPRMREYYDFKKKKSLIDDATIANYRLIGVRDPVEVDVEIVNRQTGERILWVVDGRRRVLGARMANLLIDGTKEKLLRVKVTAEKNMDEKVADLVQVSKNRFRLNDSVMMSAEQAVRLKTRGCSQVEIAVAMGVDAQTVAMYLQVVGLDARVRKMIEDDDLSPTAAAKFAGLTKDEQYDAAKKALAEAHEAGETRVTVKKAAAHAKGKKRGADGAADVVPPRRILRRVVENDEAGKILSDDFMRGIRFAIGDLKPSAVKGLTDLVHQAMPKKRSEKAAE